MFNVGDIVISKKGHDSKKKHIVIGILNDRFVLISDGKARTIAKPKMKNARHLKLVEADEEFAKTVTSKVISDQEIASKIETLINN